MELIHQYLFKSNPQFDINEVISLEEVTEWDLLITFKNGKKVLYDTFYNTYNYVTNESKEISEEEQKRIFCYNLQKLMDRKFIDQTELAKRVGTTQPMISRYITGSALPGYLMLNKLAKALSCTINDFYYRPY